MFLIYKSINPFKIKFCKKFKLDAKLPLISYYAHSLNNFGYIGKFCIDEARIWTMDVLERIDHQVVIKLHPGCATVKDTDYFNSWIVANKLEKRIRLLHKYEPLEIMQASDFTITHHTTCEFDSIAMGKYCIAIRDRVSDCLNEASLTAEFKMTYDCYAPHELLRSIKELTEVTVSSRSC